MTVPTAPTANAIHTLRAGSLPLRARTVVPTPATPATASASTPGRSAAAITVRTPDQVAILAAASLEVIPPVPRFEPEPPANASISRSTWAMSSISDADESNRGSAVNSPAWSVNSTRTSAARACASSAAIRSLSPKRSSSSARASFSLTMGSTPIVSIACSVARACRYLSRAPKSAGTTSNWPTTVSWAWAKIEA